MEFKGVRLSPDGRLMTSVPFVCKELYGGSFQTFRSSLKVWDTASGELVNILGSHSSDVLDVIFSPDSRFLASYGCDETVRLWDLSASSFLDRREKHDSGVISMILSANSEVISLAGPDNSDSTMYKFWDVNARTHRQLTFGAIYYAQVSFTPDFKFFIERENKEMGILEIARLTYVHIIKHEKSFGDCFAFSLQKRLLGKSNSYTRREMPQEMNEDNGLGEDIPVVKIWDFDDGALLHTLYGPREKTIELKFSPDGQFLALKRCSEDMIEVIEIWDVESWQLHRTFQQNKEKRGFDFFWSPDGAMIGVLFRITYPDDIKRISSCQLDICDVNFGRSVTLFVQRLDLDPEQDPDIHLIVFSVFSRDGKVAATNVSQSFIELWNLKTGQIIGKRQFTPLERELYSMNEDIPIFFSEDSQTLITRHGCLDVRSFDPNWDEVGSQDLFVDDGWIFQGLKKIMLLPHDYRPMCILAVDNTLVMGHASGHVTFLTLAPQDFST
ncbi:uncharacterized protein N7483_007498 [Penicillium malachiteum]|uniref:uncharacterized protein n=1 Tax=Penicillium malachiteum TaxID=1324776 RepID=UPI002548929A|nr:uncharacterized protein N7483_007498 [Penicillium malachiteum]KAJ5726141.1 hypothetical protein N7483_007498 [Penicillium malachiteum]